MVDTFCTFTAFFTFYTRYFSVIIQFQKLGLAKAKNGCLQCYMLVRLVSNAVPLICLTDFGIAHVAEANFGTAKARKLFQMS